MNEVNLSRPHTAVMNLQIEVHMLDDVGQCSGKVLNEETLTAVGIKSAMLFKIDGIDAEDCLKKVKDIVTLIGQKCDNGSS